MGSVRAALGFEEEAAQGPAWIMHELTPAEGRILELVAFGLSSREIAYRMAVTRQAVTWHIGNLFMKLGAENRAGLVARAYASGVIVPGCWPPRVAAEFRRLVSVDSTNTAT
jgi:DNA-binding CsgD family transcriptional regulator